MRAVRFVATLEFSLDPATEAAIPVALPSLAKVSAERVRIELLKLLGARSPSVALQIARRQGIFGVILPEADAIEKGLGLREAIEDHMRPMPPTGSNGLGRTVV